MGSMFFEWQGYDLITGWPLHDSITRDRFNINFYRPESNIVPPKSEQTEKVERKTYQSEYDRKEARRLYMRQYARQNKDKRQRYNLWYYNTYIRKNIQL